MLNVDYYARLYEAVGRCIHLGQTLDTNIRALAQVLAETGRAEIRPEEIILSERKQTLGQLLRAVHNLVNFSEDAESILTHALQARDYIAHDLFVRRTLALLDEEQYKSALRIVKAKETAIALAVGVTAGFVKGLCHVLKVDPNSILIRQDI